MLKFFRKSPGHLGLVLVLCGGIFGALTRTEVRVRLHSGGGTEMVPFRMSLNDLRVDIYDGTSFTKQVTSVLEVEGRKMETSVNHPCRYAGYRIYQAYLQGWLTLVSIFLPSTSSTLVTCLVNDVPS